VGFVVYFWHSGPRRPRFSSRRRRSWPGCRAAAQLFFSLAAW